MDPIKNKMLIVAKQVRLLIQKQERETSAPGKERVLQAIKGKIAQKKRSLRDRIYMYTTLSIASSVILLFVIGSILKESTKEDLLLEFAQQMENDEVNVGKEIILQLANKKEVAILKEDQVEYSVNGAIKVNHQTIAQAEDNSSQNEKTPYNQLTVPFGKQIRLLLSDGTHMWVNAGTRVVYPAIFDKKTREIFVDGEVYLDVAHNTECPFIVKTKQFSIQVLGTSFNVLAYAKDPQSSVVLVKGSVHVTDQNTNKVKLTPGQLTNIVNGEAKEPQFTDVEKYTSWTNNLLHFNDVPLKEIFRKLHLYYGKEFISSPEIDAIIASGTLEFKMSFTELMHTITFSLPLSYEEKGEKVYLKYDDQR